MLGNNDFQNRFFLQEYTLSEDEYLENRRDGSNSMHMLEEEKDHLSFETSQLDFRALIYSILSMRPELSQKDIAAMLGCHPVNFSRALNNPKTGVKNEWIPILQKMLLETDFSEFSSKIANIVSHKRDLEISIRRDIIVDILYSHFNFNRFSDENLDGDIYHSLFGHAGSICFSGVISTNCWHFWDYESSKDDSSEKFSKEISENPFKLLDIVSSGSTYNRATIITTSKNTFDMLVRMYMIEGKPDLFSTHNYYRSIMYIDYERRRVQHEYVITKGAQ